MKDIFSLELLSFIFETNLQELNFKNHSNSKQGKIMSDLHISCLILFHFTCFCPLLQWNWEMQLLKSLKYFSILWPMENDVRFECVSHEEMSDFGSLTLFGFTLVKKLRNFNFESHWNTLIFLIKKALGLAM